MNVFHKLHPLIDYSRFKVIIFDVDGTLYSKHKMTFYMLKHILFFLLRNPFSINEIRVIREFRRQRESNSELIVANLDVEQYVWVAQICGTKPNEVKRIVEKWMLQIPLIYINQCKHIGICKLFSKIKENDIKIGVYSDYPAESKLHALGLNVDLVVASTDPTINRFKPDPTGLIHITKMFNVEPSKCMFIGNREEKDGECAIRANMEYVII